MRWDSLFWTKTVATGLQLLRNSKLTKEVLNITKKNLQVDGSYQAQIEGIDSTHKQQHNNNSNKRHCVCYFKLSTNVQKKDLKKKLFI